MGRLRQAEAVKAFEEAALYRREQKVVAAKLKGLQQAFRPDLLALIAPFLVGS